MEKIDQAIYTSLRDDSEATVGLRALLGNTGTAPYNVYHAFLPEAVDFSPASGTAQAFITYLRVSSVAARDQHSAAGQTMEMVYNITTYARLLTTLESVQRRIRWRLQRMRGVTLPTSLAQLSQIQLESVGPHRWDDAFKVNWQVALYRAWGRDDALPS